MDMAKGYGVPGQQVDGNDVLAVYDATRVAAERARSGGGMSLIEVVTYRMKGHAQHDAQTYVPEEELEEWRRRDPIDRYVDRLRNEGKATDEELAEIDRRIEVELDEAVETALEAPRPEPEQSLAGVYAGSRAAVPWYRQL